VSEKMTTREAIASKKVYYPQIAEGAGVKLVLAITCTTTIDHLSSKFYQYII
jgi:hypothetical protein